MPIVVSGPGPLEPTVQKHPPPSQSKPLPQPEEAVDAEEHDNAGDSDREETTGQKPGDPYSSLGDAFRDYLTDRPQPIITTNRQRQDDDDLLF
jgi:hypothetical protein